MYKEQRKIQQLKYSSTGKQLVPNTLSVTNTVAVPNMESGAVQNLDFGANFADLAVKDQYGRVMDMTNQDTTTARKSLLLCS